MNRGETDFRSHAGPVRSFWLGLAVERGLDPLVLTGMGCTVLSAEHRPMISRLWAVRGNLPGVKTLAIETSGREGSVAAVENGRLLEERIFAHGLRHAAGIIPMLDEVCRAQGWKPADVSRVDVSAGTGSFTGLRIGITLAKTFALATGAKLVAVPSPRVLVENAPEEARHVIIVLDAKRGQVFAARYERGEQQADGSWDWIERVPQHLVTLKEMIAQSPRPVYLLGEGLPYHKQAIDPSDAGVIMTDESAWRPRAAVVARLGQQMADRGEYADPLKLTPIYIRLAEAEEKYLAAQGHRNT